MSTEPVWPEGYEKVVLDSVDSTNAEAIRAAPDLERPTWFLARHQHAARGRRGRDWQMPEGSFAASLAMRPTGSAGWMALRSFMAAAALFEALALYVPRTRLALKWPNDTLLDGSKVAGILLETASAADGVDWLVIGFGVNLRTAPEGLDGEAFPPVALDQDIDAEDFLLRLAGYYATEESILEQLGFGPIREKWLRNAARLGETITARMPDEEITGVFRTIDEAGHLILDTSRGERRIAAADVYF